MKKYIIIAITIIIIISLYFVFSKSGTAPFAQENNAIETENPKQNTDITSAIEKVFQDQGLTLSKFTSDSQVIAEYSVSEHSGGPISLKGVSASVSVDKLDQLPVSTLNSLRSKLGEVFQSRGFTMQPIRVGEANLSKIGGNDPGYMKFENGNFQAVNFTSTLNGATSIGQFSGKCPCSFSYQVFLSDLVTQNQLTSFIK